MTPAARVVATFGLVGAAAIAGVTEAAVQIWAGPVPARHHPTFLRAALVLGQRLTARQIGS